MPDETVVDKIEDNDNQTEPSTISEPQPETIVGSEHENPRCQNILGNRLQCQRPAVMRKESDIDNKSAMCSICISLMKDQNEAKLYNTLVTRN